MSNRLSHILFDPVLESIVGLVLVQVDDTRAAATVSSFAEAAHHPASLWVSIPKESRLHSLIEKAERFSLAVLSQRQAGLARTFGTVAGGDAGDFDRLDTYRSEQGFLFLNGALASTACQVRQAVDLNDYTLFLADIVESQIESRQSQLRQLLIAELHPR